MPRLSQYATDLTETLTGRQLDLLNQKLREFDQTTSNQIVVLIVGTIGSASLEDYTLRVVEKNRVGTKGKDNGVLLFVAKDDRQLRIEVGYGLEGALPDALSGIIIRREITPRFREGDFFGGINAGIEAIILATRNEYKADPGERKGVPVSVLIVLFIIAFGVFRAMASARRWAGTGVFRPGRRYGGWPPIGGGWGGGGGGFGGGGFSGGGGSFGGGGASGRW